MSVNGSLTGQHIQCGKNLRGVSLVEVLVSVVVISIGLLGVASLQVATLQNNHASLLRTQASALADHILDSMRANRQAALNFEYDRVIGDSAPAENGATRSQKDIYEWYESIQALLPRAKNAKADGAVSVVGNTATVTIQWGERGVDDPLTFTTVTEI